MAAREYALAAVKLHKLSGPKADESSVGPADQPAVTFHFQVQAKLLVLSPIQQAEALGHVLAVRQLGLEIVSVLSHSHGREAKDAVRGAQAMVASLNTVLELLDAPPDFYLEEQDEPG